MEQKTALPSDVENEEGQVEDSINPATPPILIESPPLTDSFVQMMDVSESSAQKSLSQEPVAVNEEIDNNDPDDGNVELDDTSTPPILLESPPLTESLIQMIGDAEQSNLATVEPERIEQQNDSNNDSNGFEYVDSIRITSMDQVNLNNESFVVEGVGALKEEASGETSSDKQPGTSDDAVQESGDASGNATNKDDSTAAVPTVVETPAASLSDEQPEKSFPWDYNMMAYLSVGIAVLAGLTYFVIRRRVR